MKLLVEQNNSVLLLIAVYENIIRSDKLNLNNKRFPGATLSHNTHLKNNRPVFFEEDTEGASWRPIKGVFFYDYF